MDSIKKYKALVSIIIFLLITNVAMLIFFVMPGNSDQKRDYDQNSFYTLLKNEVGFSPQQLDRYQQLRTEQRKKVKPLFDEIRNEKENFFGLLYAPETPDSTINADAGLIADTQKKLDLQMFNHFKMVRNLSKPEQIQKFDSSIKKVIIHMTGRSKKGKREQTK